MTKPASVDHVAEDQMFTPDEGTSRRGWPSPWPLATVATLAEQALKRPWQKSLIM
ncbi:hypothetical protein [Streptomyces massasporeus]|uniref:hypothetical protein n=1 Tax=Streptomyces massasporeus TaxID=67324 RepID=UPI0033C05268